MVLLRLAEKTTGMSQDSSDSQDPKDKKDQTGSLSSFTVDTDSSSSMISMPNITKLLNRRSFSQSILYNRTAANQLSPPPLPPPSASASTPHR